MRRVVRSRTYVAQLQELLDFGARTFGIRIVEDKRALLERAIEIHLTDMPRTGTFDAACGLHSYPVSRTPFVV